MAKSEKPPVFERLFRDRFDDVAKALRAGASWSVSADDVVAAIRAAAPGLSVKNPANFVKDYLRSPHRNALWPAHIANHGFSAKQVYGEGLVFEFLPFAPGQTEPFPDDFELAGFGETQFLEAISLPSVARALGRKDEAWLIQTCVHQRAIETHFALNSLLDVVDIFHLQNSVKTQPEVDALFLLTFRDEGKLTKALVTLEAKRDEPILINQIRAQVAKVGANAAKEAAKKKGPEELKDIKFVIGMACKTGKRDAERVVYLFELEPTSITDAKAHQDAGTQDELPVLVTGRSCFAFKPKVPGI